MEAKRRHHMAFRRHDDEVLQPADLADGGGHFGGDTGRQRRDDCGRSAIAQELVAKAADGRVRDRRERRLIIRIRDQTGDLVGFVSDDMFAQKRGKRQIGKRILRGDPLLEALRRDGGEPVAAARRRGLAEQCLEIAEHRAAQSNRCAIHREAQGREKSASPASLACRSRGSKAGRNLSPRIANFRPAGL